MALLDCSEVILLLIMAIATLKILAGEQQGWKSWASNILTVVLVVVFMVLAWILSYGWGSNTAVSIASPIFRALTRYCLCSPQTLTQEPLVLSMVVTLWTTRCRSLCKDGS